jgi:type II secretory ATPase GspE/PulE/Tfp pilus assembly ATPase PilB-like protein
MRPPAAGQAGEGIGAATYEEKLVGGYRVRVATQRLTTEASVASALSFVRPLNREINLAGGLYTHICAVEVAADTKKFAVLCSEQMAASEEMVEVLRVLQKKGFSLADGLAPNFYICTGALVLSVSKEHITGEEVAKRRKVLGNGSESNLWRTFLQVVEWALQENASDIHLNIVDHAERSQIKFTIDGKYVAPETFRMPTKMLAQMAGVVYQQSKGGNGADFQPLIEQQCRINTEVTVAGKTERIMLRWASMASDDGPQITLRPLRLDALQNHHTFESLGYLPSQRERLERAQVSEGGAVIVSGVLGSGKSTLLAEIIKGIPPTRKVVTFEDPREYVIPGAHQNTIQRSLETEDDSSFIAKIRTLKRTGFNDFMIGEIRDRQTGQAFQDVVESGPNVYTTVHARRHLTIPDRLASPFIGVDRAVLATPGILKLLVAQVLLPVNCDCATPAADLISGRKQQDVRGGDWGAYFGRIQRLYELDDMSKIRVRNPHGCEKCRRPQLPDLAGFAGRTVAAEMLEPDETFLQLVRDARNIELDRYVASMKTTPIDDPDDAGKSALQVAMYHVSQGAIDPREVEPRFEAFETQEMRRANRTPHRTPPRSVT